MTRPTRSFSLHGIFATFAFLCLCGAFPAQAQYLPTCSLSKTNQSCQLVIDRSNPVAPSTVQMYSDEHLRVIVKNPLPYERYFLDFTSAQAAVTPDVTSNIVQGLIPGLAKFQGALPPGRVAPITPNTCTVPEVANPNTIPGLKGVDAYVPKFQDCLADLARTAIPIYQHLELYVAPDSITPKAAGSAKSLTDLQADIQNFLKFEADVSGKITTIAGISGLKTSAEDAPALTKLANLQKAADAIATDLLGYYQRISDLSAAGGSSIGFQDCDKLIKLTDVETKAEQHGPHLQCVVVESRQDNQQIYQNMTTRTVTYSLDVLNLVANLQEAIPTAASKKALATVAINFADRPNKFVGVPFTALRWEASAGVFFSTLPERTFTLSSTGAVQDSKRRPTPLPFAAGNYRLTDDLGGKWKQNFYLTGAVGINPNNTTAEFGGGVSYAWRAFMVSALCHFGHDVRPTAASLTSGSTSSLPTTSHWTEAFAVGISVRVPALVGR
jgi:hypothetical protein